MSANHPRKASDVHVVDDHHHLTFRARTPFHAVAEAKHWWLHEDGAPVAYLHTLRYLNRDEYQFVLCDIEVRETHRGRGLARAVITAAEEVEGLTLYTSGGFTPLGAQALGWLPVMPGQEPGVKFDDMPFVEDWDTMRALNPL